MCEFNSPQFASKIESKAMMEGKMDLAVARNILAIHSAQTGYRKPAKRWSLVVGRILRALVQK